MLICVKHLQGGMKCRETPFYITINIIAICNRCYSYKEYDCKMHFVYFYKVISKQNELHKAE